MGKKLSEMTLEELWQLFPIILTEHSDNWKTWYQEEEQQLRYILEGQQAARISHIGSTAIDGIWAKPIIDILVEVPLGTDLQAIKEMLVGNGYICMNSREKRISFNKGYTEHGFAEKVFHLHLRYAGDHDEILFRDYLNAHSEIAKEYEELKLGLWKKFEHDRDGYTEAKAEFVMRCMREARKRLLENKEQQKKLNGIKWLFFDVGSTLVDEHFVYEEILQNIAEQAELSYEDVYKIAMEFYKENRKGDIETAKLYGTKLPKWNSVKEILYEDTVECLKELSSRYKIGIIANQEMGTAERLKKQGIRQYINIVVASAEEGVKKPDRRIFEIALERSGCSAEQAVMIGDRIDNDIVPAKQMGMHTIWVKQGFGQYWNITEEFERADYEVDSLAEICGIL